MKRALLTLSALGLLCTIIVVAYGSLSTEVMEQFPGWQTVNLAIVYIFLAMPALGFMGATLGAIAAALRHMPRWVVAFVVLAVIVLPLYGVGFLSSLQGAFIGNLGMGAAITVMLYFPIVNFLAELTFALRLPSLPAGRHQQLA